MCLSIPARVIDVKENIATVSVGNVTVDAGLDLVENVKPGDYVLIHTGFVIEKLDEHEAIETLRTFTDFEELNNQLDMEEGKKLI